MSTIAHPIPSALLLGLVITAGILNYADRQIIAVLKPMLSEDMGWSDGVYGTLAAVFQFAAVIAFPCAGWLVDRIAPKWANPLAVGAWSLAATAHGFAVTTGQFVVARIALGATEAMGTPTAIKTLSVLFGVGGRSLALGVMNAASSVGAIVTPLAVPFVALAVGWRETFILAGLCGLVWVAVWLALVGRGAWTAVSQGRREAGGVPWLAVLSDRRSWAIGGAKALSDQAWWFLLFWSPDFFHRSFHLDLTGLALPVAAIYGMAGLGALVGGTVATVLLRRGMPAARVRRRCLLAAAFLVAPVPLVTTVDGMWEAVAVLGLALAGHQAFSVNLFALITDVIPPERIGRVTSLGALCGNLAGMLIVQAAGWSLGAGQGYGPLFAFIAGAYLLAPLWLWVMLPQGNRVKRGKA